jgi:peptidoglycan hydrolase-like protein with peptidoglycan-binding domain
MSHGVAGLLLAGVMAVLGCRATHHVKEPAASGEEPRRGAARSGVPSRAGRPRVPASPGGLLAPDAVGEIQEALARRGLLAEHRRGELDGATSAAIRRFQREHGLAQTGFPDRETLTRLGVDPERAYRRARPGEPTSSEGSAATPRASSG